MGVRAHVRVREPEYGNCCLSSWARGHAEAYLCRKGVSPFGGNDDEWTFDVDGRLREVAHGLSGGTLESEFDDGVGDDLRGQGYGRDLGNLLEEGIAAADRDGRGQFTVDWW